MNGAMASAACGSSTSPLLPAVAPAASAKSSACPSKKTTATFPRRTVWCRAAGGRDDDGLLWLPRRDVLTSLSGLGAAGLVGYPGLASGALEVKPVESCRRGDKVNENLVECTDPNREYPCPPSTHVWAARF